MQLIVVSINWFGNILLGVHVYCDCLKYFSGYAMSLQKVCCDSREGQLSDVSMVVTLLLHK